MSTQTKQRLLDTAERLFSEHGIAATSLRAITTEAEANLAAVNYYFGSKEKLVRDVLARRLEPLNRERLERLAACGETTPETLEPVLRAFVEPYLRLLAESDARGDYFPRLFGRAHFEADEDLHQFFVDIFRETVVGFSEAFARCLPELAPADVFSRVLFTLGSMATCLNASMFATLSDAGSKLEGGDLGAEQLENRLIAFLVAGFQAPPLAGASA